MTLWLAVAAAGALGGACRYLIDFVVTARVAGDFPYGTLCVNLSGSLLIGVVAGLVAGHGASPAFATVAGAGFCGAYTTFSTLVYESLRLAEEGAYAQAAANLASVAAGVAATSAGWALTGL